MSKIGFIQDAFFTTVVFIFTTVVLSENFSDSGTTVVFYYSGFKIRKNTLASVGVTVGGIVCGVAQCQMIIKRALL